MKQYIEKVKKDPNQLFFDLYNTAALIFTIGALIAIGQRIAMVFEGKILLNPIALTIGQTNIYWYGVIFAMAFLFGFLVVVREARRREINIDKTINLVFWVLVFGFLGARLVFVLLNWGFYSPNLINVLNIWQGGLSLFGGIIGGGLFLIVYSLFKKENAWKALDLFAPALLIGLAIGRWGNFFNQEYFGLPSNYPVALYVHPANRPWELRSFAFFHPLFLYESLLCLILFIVLILMRKRRQLASGTVFLSFILGYSVIRFFIEFLSIESKVLWNLTLEQIISLIFATVVVAILLIKKEKLKGKKR
ncbi:MAG: prolipoprotein diacylglyceryl transferase [Patescibacteria group bacterium]|nr:prolipoprotein diacylglyceryl transferase [Patescibacteria group bacterium]